MKNKNHITSIAIGGFDGMHLAHQALFSNLDENGAIVVIETGYANITPKTTREKFSKYPIFYYDLNDIKNYDATDFVKLLQDDFPSLNKIVVGFDFRFGKDRKYCIEDLKNIFLGNLVVVDEVNLDGLGVHSRLIREFIKNGDMKKVSDSLGRNYEIAGNEVKGQGLGKKEFVPTINIEIKDYLLPCEGVYVTKTTLGEMQYFSATFIGKRASTDGNFSIETHILNKNIKNNYEKVTISFVQKIRDNKKFDSFDELKKQINEDIKMVQKHFNIN